MNKSSLKYIKKLFIISFPIILQQLFTNFASLLDTLMVGQLDEISISGIYVATQIVFVANLMMAGSLEGSTIFFSQFYGAKDEENMKKIFAYKFIFSIFIGIVTMLVMIFLGRNIALMFTNDENVINVAMSYLNIVSFGMIPFAITSSISSSLREVHNTLSPMLINLIGIISNFIFNYLFIFGKLGFPYMGASGAAVGTLINRLVEVVLIVIYLYIKRNKYQFCHRFFHHFFIQKGLFKNVLLKSIPLFLNETLWSLTQFFLAFLLTQCDSIATTVLPMVQTIYNLLFVTMLGLGNGISIIVGNTIGRGEFNQAQKQAYDSIFFTLICGIILGISLFGASDLIVSLYKGVSLSAQDLASVLIKFSGLSLLINGINTTLFFLLRSGGKSGVVFFFDSVYGWIIMLPFAFVLVNFTSLSLMVVYMLVYSIDIIKIVIGSILILKRKWYKNLVALQREKEYV